MFDYVAALSKIILCGIDCDMFSLPLWEPQVELIISLSTFGWNSFVLFLVATSQLHHVIRALLCTNTISVLIVSVAQFFLSLWCIQGSRLIGASEFHFFIPIMLYQSGYYMCACSFLLITIERVMLCYKPSLYEQKRISFRMSMILSLVFELTMVFPVVIIMQYESWNVFCATFVGLQEWITLLMVIICFRKSSLYYRTKFATVNLNSRYQVKNVIELTRAFIPIISSAVSVKLIMFALTILSNKIENFAADAHFLLRVACTSYSIFMPFLLIFQVKSLRRRLASIFPRVAISPQSVQEDVNSTTEKYFAVLLDQWR